MTFTSKLAPKKLLVGGLAAVALSLSLGASASVSAMGGNGPHGSSPVVASQCDHPGYRHFGFASRQDCLSYVASHTPGRGQGGGNGYGGNGGGHINTNVFVTISNAVNTAVNVTINFVTNIFN